MKQAFARLCNLPSFPIIEDICSFHISKGEKQSTLVIVVSEKLQRLDVSICF